MMDNHMNKQKMMPKQSPQRLDLIDVVGLLQQVDYAERTGVKMRVKRRLQPTVANHRPSLTAHPLYKRMTVASASLALFLLLNLFGMLAPSRPSGFRPPLYPEKQRTQLVQQTQPAATGTRQPQFEFHSVSDWHGFETVTRQPETRSLAPQLSAQLFVPHFAMIISTPFLQVERAQAHSTPVPAPAPGQ